LVSPFGLRAARQRRSVFSGKAFPWLKRACQESDFGRRKELLGFFIFSPCRETGPPSWRVSCFWDFSVIFESARERRRMATNLEWISSIRREIFLEKLESAVISMRLTLFWPAVLYTDV
jgi:hypothetical protein